MLSSYVFPSRHRHCKPGRRAGRKGLLLQGHPRPWPFAKARTFGAPAPKVLARIKVSRVGKDIPRPTKASCRRVQLRCGSAQYQISTVPQSGPAHIWHCSSKVSPCGLVYLWVLFLHTAAGVNPASHVPGTQRAALQAAGAAGDGCLSSPVSGQALRAVPPGASARHLPLRRLAPSVQGLRPSGFPFEAAVSWAVPAQAA